MCGSAPTDQLVGGAVAVLFPALRRDCGGPEWRPGRGERRESVAESLFGKPYLLGLVFLEVWCEYVHTRIGTHHLQINIPDWKFSGTIANRCHEYRGAVDMNTRA